MKIQVTPAMTVAIKDAAFSPDPNPVPFAGVAVSCTTGLLSQEVVLAEGASGVAVPFPVGLATAKIVAIHAADIADLIVTVDGTDHEVPTGQPWIGYNIAAADIEVSSAEGGKIALVVGG